MTAIDQTHWKSLPGPDDTSRVELSNGIVVLARSNFNSPSVVLSGYLNCGSLFDADSQMGLAAFTAQALTRGTQSHDFQQLFDLLETAGASLGFSSGTHTTSFGGRALAEDLPLLLELLSKCLRTPTFPSDQVERLKAQILAYLGIRAQDTEENAALEFDKALFAGHPYARPEEGYPETVAPIQRDDLATFHRQHYGPAGMVVVVVGAIDTGQATTMIQKVLGDWKNPAQVALPSLPSVTPLKKTKRVHVPIAGKSQTDINLGTFGPKRKSEDYLAASLGNNILGQFGMMGRIGDVVREQAGLAYHASTSLNAGIDLGTWEVNAGVNPANVERAIKLIVAELKRFVNEPVTQEELQDSQANFIGRLPIGLESNSGVANALVNLERFQLGLDYYRRFPEQVQQITTAKVLETAQRYIDPKRLVIASSGPEA
ncbi:MAG: pitrilysin family protein [Anaerolineaceae bacterium]|jgi:zinc protease